MLRPVSAGSRSNSSLASSTGAREGVVVGFVCVGRVGIRLDRRQGLGGGAAQLGDFVLQFGNMLGDLVQQGDVQADDLRLAVDHRTGHELERFPQPLLAALELGRLPAVRQVDQER
jgi:hypothetical protein